MAIKDILALVDAKLKDVFEQTKPDPSKLRAPAIKRLDTAKTQFLATEPTRGRKIWRAKNNVVEVALPFALNGETTVYVPSERFPDFVDKLKAAVEAGELDAELVTAAEGGEAPATSGRKRRGTGTSNPNKAWTPERRERFQASIAARKAAKQNG